MLKFAYLLLVALLLGAATAEYKDRTTYVEVEDDVLVVTAENFDHIVKENNEFLVIEFYAPWCGHCKKLAPEYAQAAKALKESGSNVVLAKCDATEAKALAAKYEIKGYPALKIFRGDTDPNAVTPYAGPRVKDGIIEYVTKMSGPASQEVAAENVAAFIQKSPALLGVFPDGEESEAFKAFMIQANHVRDEFDIGHTFTATDKCDATVCMFKTYDQTFLKYDGDMAVMKDWALPAAVPHVAIMDRDEKNRKWLAAAFQSDSPKLMAIAKFEADGHEDLASELQLVADNKPKDLDMVFIKADSDVNAQMLGYFGLTADQLPCVIIHHPKSAEGDSKYLLPKPAPGALGDFINDFTKGNLKRHIKSDPVPANWDAEDVKVLVAHNMEEKVTDSTKDVMIEFYAPWCGHCKKLAPIYDEIAAHYKNDDGIMIAKMDATTNDVLMASMPVKGFPTLYFVQADGNVKAYSGVRDKESIIEFIDSKRSTTAPASEDAVVEEPAAVTNDDKEEL